MKRLVVLIAGAALLAGCAGQGPRVAERHTAERTAKRVALATRSDQECHYGTPTGTRLTKLICGPRVNREQQAALAQRQMRAWQGLGSPP